MSEIEQRLSKIRKWIIERKLDALYLQRVSSFAWATCGATSYVNIASTDGASSLLITPDKQYLITSNIEAPRLEIEEKLVSQGWNFRVTPWHESQNTVTKLVRGLKVGSDSFFPGAEDFSGELARMRADLTPEEGQRFRDLGQRCAQAMAAAAKTIHPDLTEHEIAGRLTSEAETRGVQVIVNLIAVDERVFNFRHPLPTDKKLGHYVMMVICGRRCGLVCSMTRLIYFGNLPIEIRHKAEAVARVDAAMIAATRPGHTLGQIFKITQEAYASVGYPDEWQLHHQGGPAGYEPREYLATPGSEATVNAGQVYAWNPSITGYKSEDSVLISEDGFEVLSTIPSWPVVKIDVAGQIIERPDILIVN